MSEQAKPKPSRKWGWIFLVALVAQGAFFASHAIEADKMASRRSTSFLVYGGSGSQQRAMDLAFQRDMYWTAFGVGTLACLVGVFWGFSRGRSADTADASSLVEQTAQDRLTVDPEPTPDGSRTLNHQGRTVIVHPDGKVRSRNQLGWRSFGSVQEYLDFVGAKTLDA